MLTLKTFKAMVAAAGTDIRAGEKMFSELDAASGAMLVSFAWNSSIGWMP